MGRIKGIVLNAKHGVITEERFQKMTTVQWIFHYKEVMQGKEEQELIIKRLFTQLELVGTMANPPSGKALADMRKIAEERKELDADNFEVFFEDLKKRIPSGLTIKLKDAPNKFLLPKYKREGKNLGITIKEKGGEK